MKLIVGLGNPGPEYVRTRHNAGFMAIDRLAARHAPTETPRSRFNGLAIECSVRGHKTLLLKPLTFMNRSGQSISQAAGFYKIDTSADLLVIVDEAAIGTGSIKLRPSGSDGGHNGLVDVQRALGGENYPRLRIGIGPRPPMITLHDFVLGRFADAELIPLKSAIEKACDATELFITDGLDAAMNKFNRKDEPPTPPAPTRPPPTPSQSPPPPGTTRPTTPH